MTPVSVTGFNRDLVVESTASGPPFDACAVELNPGEGMCFYQAGLPGKSRGLPAARSFVSAVGDGTTFELQPYTNNNALVLSGSTTTGTLALSNPRPYLRLALIAHSGGGGGTASLTLNFTDGSSVAASYNAADWFNNTGYALRGFERITLSSGATQGGTDNPRFYQTTLDLAALGLAHRALASITFNKFATAGATAVYALSCETAPATPAGIVRGPLPTTVPEAGSAGFDAVVTGYPLPTLQWLRNGAPLAGATGLSYAHAVVPLAWDGSVFSLVASNFVNGSATVVTSAPALLTVVADLTPPVLVRAFSSGLTNVQAVFSKPLLAATATNLVNFTLSGPAGAVPVLGALLDATRSNGVLQVHPLSEGSNYLLVVNGVRDLTAAGNVIATNASAMFVASAYVPISIGDLAVPGSQTVVPGGLDVTGGGNDVGLNGDRCFFSHQPRTGDFDVMVRLASLSLADAWSGAGLLVREDLSPGSRSVGAFATPTISGCYFQFRNATNAPNVLSGSYPVNYPNQWLRLKRAGDVFTGYAGGDGRGWTQLGTVTMTSPATLLLGFAVSSRDAAQTVAAAFRDFQTVTNASVAAAPPFEGPGQCNRRGSLAFTEIMYHPTNSSLEFVELLNTRGEPQDLGGWRIAGSIAYVFPPGTVLPGGGLRVVAKDPAALEAACGLSAVCGPFAGDLPNSSGKVRLINPAGGVFLDLEYGTTPPWPVAPDGGGHSLVLATPSWGENSSAAWAASDAVGGSPGRLESSGSEPLRGVVINELLAHTDPPDSDYLELYNHDTVPADLSGCVLTDDAALDRFIVPPGTVIPPGGFVAFHEAALGFALSAQGETVWLKNPARTRVLDVARFEAQANGVAWGRFPDGAPEWYPLAAKTPGQPNAPARLSAVVINELMYHPGSGEDDDQFIELYNRSASPVNLGGWKLDDGVSFTFATNTVIPADGYLVVARLATRLFAKYPNLNPANTVGNFSGSLSGSGERVVLTMPDTLTSTNSQGVVKTNLLAIPVDEVTYGTGGRWPRWADGGGSSLELRDPCSNHRLPSSWGDSDETHKAPWSILSATGTVDNGSTTANQLQVLLMGEGECLLDNVEVVPPAGGNLVTNSTFETGVGGWTAEGTESGSGWETAEGYNSARSYHIVASDRGDNQLNRIRVGLNSPLASGTTNVTLRAALRWLKGAPEMLLRLRGNWLECAGELALPSNPGTPGARNSGWLSNAPPAITQVRHDPVLPAAGQPVVVRARVEDPDGVGTVTLRYRLDPVPTYSSTLMTDDGTGADTVAGDGVYSATIPGKAAGSLVAFCVEAADRLAPGMPARFPVDAPLRECLVRVGETQPVGNLPVYRLWMTQATASAWASRSPLNNTALDVTFVLGNTRVIYNASALYAGSPYIAPGYSGPASGRCGYSLSFPKDDLFLGSNDLVLDWPGGHGNETTAMQEQLGYWIADRMQMPFSHRYTIRLHVNGVTDEARQAVFEAVQQPGSDYVRQWSDGLTTGDFFKVDRAFEFNDSGGMLADPQPRLQNFTTTGGLKKREKYRWNFMFRGSDRVNNYTNLFALVDALNAPTPEPYTTAVQGSADVEQWMRVFAVSHIINNFDAYGHEIGKNMYAWRPDGGRWQFYLFDLDWLMLAALNHGYTASSGALFNSEDPVIASMYAFPPFARAYWRAVSDALAGPFQPADYQAVMDAKYQSLVANNVKWCDGNPLTGPAEVKTWFAQRRAFMEAQLATVASPFAVNASVTTSNGLGVLSGVAPVTLATLAINGLPWKVTWTSVSNWIALVPLVAGSNAFAITGLDARGLPVAGASNFVSTVSAGTPAPDGSVVISEILYNPVPEGAQFVELFNQSTNTAFDLSGLEVNGLGYTFPGGSSLAPRGRLVLAKSRLAAQIAYGVGAGVFDEFPGTLQADGETLSLLRPGIPPGLDVVVDRVRYEPGAPWPVTPSASSLQLIAPARDNARPGNWAVGQSSPGITPQWAYFWTNFTAPSSRLYLYLQSAGEIYLDDLKVVAGTMPEQGRNCVTNGDFELPLAGRWTLAGNFTSSVLSTAVKHTGSASLRMIATAAGSGSGNAISQDLLPALTSGASYTLSFWFLQSTNGGPLAARFSGASSPFTVAPAPFQPAPGLTRTPGTSNSVERALTPFPNVSLNELQPENLTGPVDNFGEHDPWIELHNPGTNTLALDGLFLGTNYASPALWVFPPQTSLAPGQFLTLWTDGQPQQSTGGVLHTSFRLPPGSGTLALSRYDSNALQMVDYLTYSAVPANQSYGDFPDGQPFYRRTMFLATPGATNSAVLPALSVFINEWMAENTGFLLDPATSKYDDWFELYNPSDAAAELGGYYLTDNLANRFQFEIPAGFRVPAHGYLLVWADGKASANTNPQTLHTSFKLDKAGEAIGLFSPAGVAMDAVTFGTQSANISEGRIPDGGNLRLLLPAPTPGAANLAPPALSPPSVTALGWVGPGILQLTFQTWPGHAYRVEYRTDLQAAPWQPLGTEVLATGDSLSWQDSVAAGDQRFYRIVQVE